MRLPEPRLLLVLCHLLTVHGLAIAAPTLTNLAFTQKPGSQIPLRGLFADELGRRMPLGQLFEGRPVVLVLGYFHCRKLCSLVRSSILEALTAARLVAGRDYSFIALSIDPTETMSDAAAAKASDLQHSSVPSGESDLHYLTGTADSLSEIAGAIGFSKWFDAASSTFAHPVGAVFITGTGLVSSYLLGLRYTATDTEHAVSRAMAGDIDRVPSSIMLLCFDFDRASGRYSVAVLKILRLAAVLTMCILGGSIVVMQFRRPCS